MTMGEDEFEKAFTLISVIVKLYLNLLLLSCFVVRHEAEYTLQI